MKPDPTLVVDAAAVATIVGEIGIGPLYDLAIERLTEVLTSAGPAPAAPPEPSPPASAEMKARDGFLLTAPRLGLLEWMPAVRHGATVSMKLVGYHPHNPVKNQLPTILSTLLAFDVDSGHLRAIVDGTFATAVRTGAASALATRMLARPGGSVLGLVGCGAQAVTQLHALARVLPLTEVLVCDSDIRAETTFAARARVPEGLVRVAERAEVEERADVLCTATSVAPAQGPVIQGTALRPWAHINAVGSDMPGKTELPVDLLRHAVVVPDHREQAVAEGECQQLRPDEIGPCLPELLNDPGRQRELRGLRTVYDSTGLALQDLVMVELLEELALDVGAGQRLVIEATAHDPQDPYGFLPESVTRACWPAEEV
ncbi:ornithine cyclodeaminase family protein [Streptomyces sp. NPDC048665]|uniref:ornithine cyclodeaminase family protein n=1 Tax=Streptomyces sp. NPDC048665 TaxID=3155490 RepID=UPI00343C7CB7